MNSDIQVDEPQNDNGIRLFTIKDMLNSLGITPSNNPIIIPSPKLEYLFEDEHGNKGPSFGARLCYGTGFTYLTGLGIGGVWGLFEGLAHPEARTSKLRINSVLNACTRRGPFLANNMGIVALMYNFIHSGFLKATDRNADMYSVVGSSFASGYLLRASSGTKNAVIAALACSSVMTVVEMIRNWKTYSYKIHTFLADH